MIDELIAKLEAGLAGVTPGPWKAMPSITEEWSMGGDRITTRNGMGYIHKLADFSCDGERQFKRFEDASHIALCSPDNIRLLLDEVKRLRAVLAPGRST